MLRLAEALAHAVAALVALRCCSPRSSRFAPGARPLAAFLILSLAADIARAVIGSGVLAGAARPFTGAARAFFHLDQALFLTWPVAVVLLVVLTLFRPSNGWPLAIAGATCAGMSAWFASSYPALRGVALGKAYTSVHVFSTGLALVVVLGAARAGAWFDRPRRAVTWLVVGEIATMAGPYAGRPFDFWWTAQAISVVVYLLVARALWHLRAQ